MGTQIDLFDARNRAESAAQRRFGIGVLEQDRLLDAVASTVIRDRLVSPTAMKFEVVVTPQDTYAFCLRYDKDATPYAIHRHAMGQLASKVDFPLTYLNKLNTVELWRLELLATNLNTLFCNTKFPTASPRFLHRLVGDELRGFLSRRFNRHLASMPMLHAFVVAFSQAGAKPIEASSSDVRSSLKAYLPHVFEAYPGQFICVGVEWTNSDFGAGKLTVSQTIWDPLRGTRAVLDEPISRVHLGSIIEDSDIELSEETMVKEVEAQASAISDAVTQQLSEKSVERMLQIVKLAHEENIAYSKLRNQWARLLSKKELETIDLLEESDILDLPPAGISSDGSRLRSRWWGSAVLSHLADKTTDEDRRSELQREAGKLLALSAP